MGETKIELRNIKSLSGIHFYIPDYQRGYRWSDAEANKMLEDFKEFYKQISRGKVGMGEFYCLQPIIVKEKRWTEEENGQEINVDGYEVIDGQQRLTTIYILLKCVEKARKYLYGKFNMYSIKYETRLEFDSQKFLENIDSPSEDSNKYIDFYCMKTVYDGMCQWFEENTDDDCRNGIIKELLSESIDDETGADNANNVRLIWYEVTDEETSSEDLFTRLNIGKIPLTNAELIKALLLRRSNFPEEKEATLRQLQISTEWNQMEQRLQDDAFWYFLYRTSCPFKYENRIEFIFDLMKGRTPDSEFYHTFNEFYKQWENPSGNQNPCSGQSKIEAIWQEVKNVYQTFEEWYQDRTLYHYIGFLIEYGVDINKLKEKSLSLNKREFLDFIKVEIKALLKDVNLSGLSYGDKNVKKVLLLFNIETILQSDKSDMRFPFNKYKKEKWDIEHISSQTDKRINTDNERLGWIKDMLTFFIGTNEKSKLNEYQIELNEYLHTLIKEVEEIRIDKSRSGELDRKEEERSILSKIQNIIPDSEDEKIDETKFDEVFEHVQRFCGEGEDKLEYKDSIYNLTLLDAETNRSYGNAFFPIKRKRIIGNDKKGNFIPIATKNVFLKYYTRKGDNLMYWEKSDAEDYLENLEETIKEYLTAE